MAATLGRLELPSDLNDRECRCWSHPHSLGDCTEFSAGGACHASAPMSPLKDWRVSSTPALTGSSRTDTTVTALRVNASQLDRLHHVELPH
jgi:hypothetical protein